MISSLLLFATAADASSLCQRSSDCPDRFDAQRAVVAYHGGEMQAVLRHPEYVAIKDVGKARIRSVVCRRTGEGSARCEFTATYKVSFKGAHCQSPSNRQGSSSGSGCVGESSKTRRVVYLADFKKNNNSWTIESADYVAGLN